MRLIDVDDFFERINNDTDICAEMELNGIKVLKKYLDLQPAAYDIDKVVEKLESKKNELVSEGCSLSAHQLVMAIKIVKAGVRK